MPRTGLTQDALRYAALDAAEAAIRRYGIEKASLVDVAKQLGVTHSALYKLFPDKNALMDAVSDRWLQGTEVALDAITHRQAPAAQRLREWFVRLHTLKRDKVLADPELYAAFDRAATRARPFIERHLQVIRDQIETILTQGMAVGEFRRRNPKALAQTLFEATLAFHHPRSVREHRGHDRIPELRKVLELLCAGLALGESKERE
jgi:AcrR family transcriptional regulator